MYKVSGNLMSAYGSDIDAGPKKSGGPEMPHVTSDSRRMTNVKLSNGEYVQGIRRNAGSDLSPSSNGISSSTDPLLKPLRYTPGMSCDPHLESLRPERSSKHPAFQGSDQWKKHLIPPPGTYEGSFVDADMQQFRPNPRQPAAQDPWYTSRVPDPQYFPANERLGGTQFLQQSADMTNPYDQIYPQDELSRIKMRNRRFQNTCGQEMMNPMMGNGYGGGGGMMMGPPPPPPMRPQSGMMMMGQGGFPQQQFMQQQNPMMMASPQQQQMMLMQQQQMMPQTMDQGANGLAADMNELALLDQELNMTRRATRPFVPSHIGGDSFNDLQKQRQIMEEPSEVHVPRLRVNPLKEPPTSIDQLPPPKTLTMTNRGQPISKETLEAAAAAKPKQEVRIADQIAIRSLVLGKSLDKMGKTPLPEKAPKESQI